MIGTIAKMAAYAKAPRATFALRHPREAYRTREVRAHLASLKLEISPQDFRAQIETTLLGPVNITRTVQMRIAPNAPKDS